MNGTEQQARHTAVQALQKRLEDVETVVDGLAQQFTLDRVERDRLLHALVDNVNAVLEQGHAAQKAYIDHADALIAADVTGFRAQSFWQRLRWLLVGL